MKEFTSAHGNFKLDNKKRFLVDGKEIFNNVQSISYIEYKRDTYVYIHFKSGLYKIYSLKTKKVLLSNINRIIYKSKTFVIVVYGEGNKEKYYLYNFLDESQNRYIKKLVNHVILEKDGITLTSTHPAKDAIILPKECKDLCAAKEVIDFFAITKNNEILILAPYPYNSNENTNSDTLLFWKLKEYVNYKILRCLKFKDLADFILFKNDDEKKLFALVSILYEYKPEKVNIYIDNIKNVLTKKQITFKDDKFNVNVTLTLDKIVLEDKYRKSEYEYNIFEYDDFYLQNLILYHIARNFESKIRSFAVKKLTVEDIENSSEFSGNRELLKRLLYNFNCNPNSKTFYIINNQNKLVIVNKEKLVEIIKNALISGKNFMAIMYRYDLNTAIIKKMIKENHPSDYTILKKRNAFKFN